MHSDRNLSASLMMTCWKLLNASIRCSRIVTPATIALPYVDINEPNNERKGLVSPIANHANVRKYILILAAGFVNTLMPGEDTLISKGFSMGEEAQSTTDAFEQYCCDHCDDIEALRILYNNEGEPITYSMLKDLENKLKMENNRFAQKLLWNSYAIVYGDKVRRTTKKEESEALQHHPTGTLRLPSDRKTGKCLSYGSKYV